jgi:hypothetical protein
LLSGAERPQPRDPTTPADCDRDAVDQAIIYLSVGTGEDCLKLFAVDSDVFRLRGDEVWREHQRPLNSAGRFSMKALTPSRKSSV